jgi:hypothetical protein
MKIKRKQLIKILLFVVVILVVASVYAYTAYAPTRDTSVIQSENLET